MDDEFEPIKVPDSAKTIEEMVCGGQITLRRAEQARMVVNYMGIAADKRRALKARFPKGHRCHMETFICRDPKSGECFVRLLVTDPDYKKVTFDEPIDVFPSETLFAQLVLIS